MWRSHLSWPVLGIFLVVGAWYSCVWQKKGDFTSEASSLCLGRAHKSLGTVGHSPREGGQAKINLSNKSMNCTQQLPRK